MTCLIAGQFDATMLGSGLASQIPTRKIFEVCSERGLVASEPLHLVVLHSNNVIRGPWRVSLTLPPGARLWDVEGIPAAEIISGGRLQVLAFDSPIPRPFSRFSVINHGIPIARDAWDQLVNTSRAQRPATRPNTASPFGKNPSRSSRR